MVIGKGALADTVTEMQAGIAPGPQRGRHTHRSYGGPSPRPRGYHGAAFSTAPLWS